MSKRFIVCGGRDYNDKVSLYKSLDNLKLICGKFRIIHGGALGADNLAGMYGKENDLVVKVYKADWDKYGKAAGHIRNKEMLRCNPHAVIAFTGGRGTAHMCKIATEAGVMVWRPVTTFDDCSEK